MLVNPRYSCSYTHTLISAPLSISLSLACIWLVYPPCWALLTLSPLSFIYVPFSSFIYLFLFEPSSSLPSYSSFLFPYSLLLLLCFSLTGTLTLLSLILLLVGILFFSNICSDSLVILKSTS